MIKILMVWSLIIDSVVGMAMVQIELVETSSSSVKPSSKLHFSKIMSLSKVATTAMIGASVYYLTPARSSFSDYWDEWFDENMWNPAKKYRSSNGNTIINRLRDFILKSREELLDKLEVRIRLDHNYIYRLAIVKLKIPNHKELTLRFCGSIGGWYQSPLSDKIDANMIKEVASLL